MTAIARQIVSLSLKSSSGIAIGLLVVGATSLSAQATWSQLSPAQTPPARAGIRMVYDSQRKVSIIFGGTSYPITHFSDTWGWNGTDWQRLATDNPSGREFYDMVYDAARDRVVLFGGARRNQQPFADTWEWDGSTWTEISTTSQPEARLGHAMAYDSRRKRVLLFGGRTWQGQDLADTWTWDGSSWQQLTPANAPSARSWTSMAYDPKRDRVVLFGGEKNPPGVVLGDTWEWDGGDWVQRTPRDSPSPRSTAGMNFDSRREVVVLVGGGALTDTWDWDGNNWAIIPASGIPNRVNRAIAYDSGRDRFFMFGGGNGTARRLDETWMLNIEIASYKQVGVGCKGSASGIPVLSARTRPTLGTNLVIDLTEAPPIAPAFLFFSFTPTSFNLGPIGAPGCTAYANGHVSMSFVTDFNGEWFGAFPVPVQPTFLGAQFWNQFFIIDRGANPLGIIVSNGNVATLGF